MTTLPPANGVVRAPFQVDRVASPIIVGGDARVCLSECVISLQCATEGATIYYSTNGSAPSNTSTELVYRRQLRVFVTTNVSVRAYKPGLEPSDVVVSGLQRVRAAAPVFTPASRALCPGGGASGCNISLSSATPDVIIYYRIFEQLPQAASACRPNNTYTLYHGGAEVAVLPSQALAAIARGASGNILDSFEVFWRGDDGIGAETSSGSNAAAAQVFSKVCSSTSFVKAWTGCSLTLATAGVPSIFLIFARDAAGLPVEELFDGMLPWRISAYREIHDDEAQTLGSADQYSVRRSSSSPVTGTVFRHTTMQSEGEQSSTQFRNTDMQISESKTAGTAGCFVGVLTSVVAETHRVYVQLGKSDIIGSPFLLSVKPAALVCGSKSSLAGSGLSKATMMPGRNVFTIQARDQYGNHRPGLLPVHLSFYARVVRMLPDYGGPQALRTLEDPMNCGDAPATICSGSLPAFEGISAGGKSPPKALDPQPTIHAMVMTQEAHLPAGIGSCVETMGGGGKDGVGSWNVENMPEIERNVLAGEHPAYYYVDRQVGACGNQHFLHAHLLEDGGVHATYYATEATGLSTTPQLSAPGIMSEKGKKMTSVLGFPSDLFSGITSAQSLDPSMQNEVSGFVVRWSGMLGLEPHDKPLSRKFIWHGMAPDDRVRLWVDNRIIIDQWASLSDPQPSAVVTLSRQELKYDLHLEFGRTNTMHPSMWYNNTGSAFVDVSGVGNEAVIAFEDVSEQIATIAFFDVPGQAACIAFFDVTGSSACIAFFDVTGSSACIAFFDIMGSSACIAFFDVTTQNAQIAVVDVTANSATISSNPSGGVDDQATSTTLTLSGALTDLDVNDYIKSASNEYMKVTNIAGNTLTVERNAAPPGLTQGSLASAADGETVTLAEGGISNSDTTLILSAAINNLDQNEFLKIGSEYVKVTNIGGTGALLNRQLTIERNGNPCGLTQAAAAAAAAAGETVFLAEGGIDNSATTLKLEAAIGTLDVGEYLKTEANEYLKVTAKADSDLTLTIERDGNPCGLTQKGSAAAAAAGETVTLYEGGIDNDDTTLKIHPPLTGLDVNEYVKTESGEYLAVSAISTVNSVSTLTVSRSAAPLGLTQGSAAAAAAGEDVTLAAMNDDGFHPNDSTGANLAAAPLGVCLHDLCRCMSCAQIILARFLLLQCFDM